MHLKSKNRFVYKKRKYDWREIGTFLVKWVVVPLFFFYGLFWAVLGCIICEAIGIGKKDEKDEP